MGVLRTQLALRAVLLRGGRLGGMLPGMRTKELPQLEQRLVAAVNAGEVLDIEITRRRAQLRCRYAGTDHDLIAARNTVAHLVLAPRDEVDPPSQFRRDSIRLGVRIGVAADDEPYSFEADEEAARWLIRLRD